MPRIRSLRVTAGGTALAAAGALLVALLPAAPAAAVTENPIIGDGSVYSADPATLVVDDTLYIFAGRDEAGPEVNDFIMNEWQAFSTSDVDGGSWEHHPSLMRPEEVFDWATPGRAYAGQVVEGAGQPVPQRGGDHRLLGVALGVGVRQRRLVGQLVVAVPAPPGQVRVRAVRGDPVQPGGELGLTTELPDALVGTEIGLLHHVLGFGGIVHEPRHQTHQAALVLGYEQVERPPVTGLDTLHQHLISLALCRHGPCPIGCSGLLFLRVGSLQ